LALVQVEAKMLAGVSDYIWTLDEIIALLRQ